MLFRSAKPLMKGDWAICFLNRSIKTKKIEFDWANNIINDDFIKRELNAGKDTYKISDIWNKRDLGNTKKKLTGDILSHDVLMIRLTKQ